MLEYFPRSEVNHLGEVQGHCAGISADQAGKTHLILDSPSARVSRIMRETNATSPPGVTISLSAPVQICPEVSSWAIHEQKRRAETHCEREACFAGL